MGGVFAVRRRDVDDVDLSVGDQLLVRPVGAFESVAGGERCGTVERARPDSDDLLAGVCPQCVDEVVRDPPGRKDAPPQRRSIGRVGVARRWEAFDGIGHTPSLAEISLAIGADSPQILRT